jgi:hypothetical protein
MACREQEVECQGNEGYVGEITEIGIDLARRGCSLEHVKGGKDTCEDNVDYYCSETIGCDQET